VPPFAIHVFAALQDTLASAERSAQERRLARATTQIRIGGVAAAVVVAVDVALMRPVLIASHPLKAIAI
jgi:hypothetical protein